MGKRTGFKEFDREDFGRKSVEDRIKDYKEFSINLTEKQMKDQGARCMNCGVPFCQSHYGCPLGNVIPDFNHSVYEGDWKEALQTLLSTNNFPEFTGRVCPAPCETSCVLGINKPPVTIKNIEVSIIDKAFEEGWVTENEKEPFSGHKVAVVGSGPSGLAVADQLNKAGHDVTVFEKDRYAGGLLRYGIPDFKLEKSVVERRVHLMERSGVTFRLGCEVGKDVKAQSLHEDYSALVLCGGSIIPRDLPIQGREGSGIYFAMEFLKQSNQRVSGEVYQTEPILAKGQHVVVIGGGDTGSDCIGTSLRQGALSITQLEIMDRPPEMRDGTMPWPQYPRIFRISSSQEEADPNREYAVLSKKFILNNQSEVTGVQCCRIQWKGSSDFSEIEGSDFVIPADMVFLAMGFVGYPKDGLVDELSLQENERGNLRTEEGKYQTLHSGIFVAGDMRRGQSLVVWAISEGRECAREVDAFLKKRPSYLNGKEDSFYKFKKS